jgi:hypothetical protein
MIEEKHASAQSLVDVGAGIGLAVTVDIVKVGLAVEEMVGVVAAVNGMTALHAQVDKSQIIKMADLDLD